MATKFTNDTDFVNTVLAVWAKDLIAERRRNVQATQSINTKELLQSYDYEVRKATIDQVASALIAFDEKARFLDMKRIDRKRQQLPVEEIEQWLLDGGLNKFRQLPTNKQGETAVNNRQMLNDLAWGIVRKKQIKGREKRRKLQTGFGGSIIKLMEELRDGYQDRTIAEIIQSIQSN